MTDLPDADLAEDGCGLEFESATESDSDWMPGPSRLDAPGDSALPITRVPADLVSGGYDRFRIRTDLVPSYEAVHGTVKALGGVLTSIGGLRDLTAQVTAGRSGTSLHYTGRAIDLFTRSGMQPTPGPYVVTRDGGTDANPLWKIYCVAGAGDPSHPRYDAALISERDLPEATWKGGTGITVSMRRVRCFCLTDVLAAQGWVRIPARRGWQVNYLCCEWWHFQNQTGLTAGQSRFGDELRRIWPANHVAASGLALNAVWHGQSFRAPASDEETSRLAAQAVTPGTRA